ncbi:MAG: hypothetical protein ACRDV3_09465 [Acidothermaceae bacterium]
MTSADALRRPARVSSDPEIDDDVTGAELSREARAELRTAAKGVAEFVAKHLVMAGRLVDDEPALAYAHALSARQRLPRLAVVREAVGLCAYANGKWSEALAELRASRRINGSIEHLAVMADCERGLGRPERAVLLAGSPDAAQLSKEAAVEMQIVVSGARRDMGQVDAAVVALQGPELQASRRDPWSPRLFYAYADALLAAGRALEAREWFVNAAIADTDDAIDAADRVAEIDAADDAGAAGGGVRVAAMTIVASPSDDLPSTARTTTTPPDDGAGASAAANQAEFLLIFEEPAGP